MNFALVTKISDDFDFKLLPNIAELLAEILEFNDAVLFYYCDSAEIFRSKKNMELSPQNFRFNLFNLLFDGLSDNRFMKDVVIIYNNGEHFISMISTPKNKKILT